MTLLNVFYACVCEPRCIPGDQQCLGATVSGPLSHMLLDSASKLFQLESRPPEAMATDTFTQEWQHMPIPRGASSPGY